MEVNQSSGKIEVIRICPASFLLQIPEAGISWIFNAWPDTIKFLIQRNLSFNGIVYPDLKMQKGVSCNLIEFPLLYAIFAQGLLAKGERPFLVGTDKQIKAASEGFRRGLFGFYDISEMEGCDLTRVEMESLMREIEGLSFNGLQPVDAFLAPIPLAPLESHPSRDTATEFNGVRIWKEGINVFGVEWKEELVQIDCNLGPDEFYTPPLDIDVKNIPFRLFQIIDSGEEDGFSPKSCMHTVIQWRDKILCVDLPMNVSYLLEKVSISRTEIDAVIFSHNHDDHIGDLALLLQMDKKVTIICPKIIWKAILLKASKMFDMEPEELGDYFNHIPIRYGEEYDYAGLRILAQPSIHPVPCAMYRIRGIVDREWKVYSHLSDILNLQRCQELVRQGYITQKRFSDYKNFILAPATVKKIDVGTRAGTEAYSVHGSWKDFEGDPSEHIILGHIQGKFLEDKATVTVGQIALAGSARDMGERLEGSYQDKYRERALKILADYLFGLLEENIQKGLVARGLILDYLRILSDNEIRVIQPNTPFLKLGGKSTFVDVVISGVGSIWVQRGGDLVQVAKVNAGDVIGDMGVLQQIPRTASIRSDTYMYVLRIPGPMFREIAVLLGLFPENIERQEEESLLQKIWRLREIVQGTRLFGIEVPVYLQNKIAQQAEEVRIKSGQQVYPVEGFETALVLGSDSRLFALEVGDKVLPPGLWRSPVFGESGFLKGIPDRYRVTAQRGSIVLRLDRQRFGWIFDIPIFKLRLKRLSERRAVYVSRAFRKSNPVPG